MAGGRGQALASPIATDNGEILLRNNFEKIATIRPEISSERRLRDVHDLVGIFQSLELIAQAAEEGRLQLGLFAGRNVQTASQVTARGAVLDQHGVSVQPDDAP